MEHQVFVPVPADSLRAVLRDPVRVARCVPGLQQDADTESGPLSGRLKIRVGGSTVTYRGALSVAERDPDHFAVDGEGAEVRGSGTVKLTLALRLTPEGDRRTRIDFTGGATADGRAAAFTAAATATAVQRLLDQTAARLAEATREESAPGGAAGPDEVSDPVADAEEAEGGESAGPEGTDGDDVTEVTASVFDTDVPPPSLDPFLAGGFDDFDDLGDLPRPPAEAAHARRTMIGRSAEEVDHAPPRGRYAPVPAPATTTAADSLRWLAPAAALALASAVVIGRALRRRR
ncbi:SRPBCC domain-containing protein [Streptomyces sp. LARHCF249]